MFRLIAFSLILAAASVINPVNSCAVAHTPEAQVSQRLAQDNARLARLFTDDQAARNVEAPIDWTLTAAEDTTRRQEVRRMLDADEVRSAADFYHAAFIFQHGDQPDDYLLAHALAVTAIELGHERASWIAAATLDRYLQSIGREQIYGTQFQFSADPAEPPSQGDFNTGLVTDAMRAAARVPPLAEQQRQVEALRERQSQ